MRKEELLKKVASIFCGECIEDVPYGINADNCTCKDCEFKKTYDELVRHLDKAEKESCNHG